MKNNLLILLMLFAFKGNCQWSNTGNNATTGKLAVGKKLSVSDTITSTGKFISTGNYGFILKPVSGDAIIRRENPGNLIISSGGGESGIRFNYNYGGGSGGVMIYDGGVDHHGDLWVTNGQLNISASGRNVVIGSAAFSQKLTVTGDLSLGLDGAISTISGSASSGAIQIKNHSSLGGVSNRYLRLGWKDNNAVFTPVLSINDNLNVGIGTTTPDTKLTVKGVIHTNEVRIDLDAPIQGPDYVFEKDYDLLSLAEVEAYIKANKHLPEVPSAKEMAEEGLHLKEMNLLLLKKVEELTLYLIEVKKENMEIVNLRKRIEALEKVNK